MIRLVASVLARRRPVGAIGVVVLVATLLVSAGAAAQQEDLPELTITVANGGVVNENVSTGKLVFTARLNKTWGADVTFTYTLEGDGQAEHEASLVEDFDYPGSSSEGVTITAGQRSATIEVVIIDDALDEHDEEGFVFAPDNPTNAVLSDDIAHYYDEGREVLLGHWVAGTIRDNDDLPELMLRDDDNVTTESGRYLRYQLTLSEPSGRPVRVRYEVVPGLARNSNGDLINRYGLRLVHRPGRLPSRRLRVRTTGDTYSSGIRLGVRTARSWRVSSSSSPARPGQLRTCPLIIPRSTSVSSTTPTST